MAERSKKNVYLAKFEHPKTDIPESELHVVAVSFDDAVKKANENTELVMTSKEDVVNMTGIKLALSIDVD